MPPAPITTIGRDCSGMGGLVTKVNSRIFRTSNNSERVTSVSRRGWLDQFERDSVRICKINGVATFVHPGFDCYRPFGLEFHTQGFHPFEFLVDVVNHEGPVAHTP